MNQRCILCNEKLEIIEKQISKETNQIQFFCESCGFQSVKYHNLDREKAYASLITNKQLPSSIPTGFQKNNRKSSSRIERLEEDKLILENVERVQQKLKNSVNLPEPIKQIISDHGHHTIFYRKFPQSLPEIGDLHLLNPLKQKLEEKGIHNLFKFQEQAFKAIDQGKHVVISAPTGLGKTEAFLLPIITQLLQLLSKNQLENKVYAFLIYPTKALAADQLQKIRFYCNDFGIRVAKFDGDTSSADRQSIYSHPPHLLITNPDMIHYHLMSNISFKSLIKSLRYIVLDEIHLCVSSFGSNILWILRRIQRFTNEIQFIGASATISNAKQFAEMIFDTEVQHISVGTARKSDLFMTMIYPKERSNLSTMSNIIRYFVTNGNKTIGFGNGHLATESLNLLLKRQGINSDIHRAGLSLSHRKKVENAFKQNRLDVLISTPTLELGIDIGSLDSCVTMLTNLTSFVQRIGRAGRKGQDSYATLVLRGDDPISAYYARNPEEYLSDLQPAFVEPLNSVVAYHQLLAMILDKALDEHEVVKYQDFLEDLISQQLIGKYRGQLGIKNRQKIQTILKDYSIRGIGKSVTILSNNKVIGNRALPLALSELHPGAIYLHGGRSYKVQFYSPLGKVSNVSMIKSGNERTQALRSIWPEINTFDFETTINGLATSYCSLTLTETVSGYVKKSITSNEVLEKHLLPKPINYEFKTKGFVISMPKPISEISHLSPNKREEYLGGTYHAIEHVLIESGNSITGGGANQIGGISMGDTGLIFVYDGNEGGSGLSKLLFDSLIKGLGRSLKILEDCPCKREDGCPRCTYSYQCGNNNQPLNRMGAIDVLNLVGTASTDLDLNFDGIKTYVMNPKNTVFND